MYKNIRHKFEFADENNNVKDEVTFERHYQLIAHIKYMINVQFNSTFSLATWSIAARAVFNSAWMSWRPFSALFNGKPIQIK